MDIFQQLATGSWINPDTRQPFRLPVSHIALGQGVRNRIPEIIASIREVGVLTPNLSQLPRSLTLHSKEGSSHKIYIISDPNTFSTLGQEISHMLPDAKTITFPEPPKASMQVVESLIESISGAEMLIAVGSGTINDLCKYASFQLRIPYMVVATAPSMNGYLSANASLVVKGHKKTLPAHLPSAVVMDTEILAKAPLRLIRSGIGDSLCRSTCQADWLLSYYLLDTPYQEAPFALLATEESTFLAQLSGMVAGEVVAIEALCRTLLLSGIGMYLAGGSYPASQGEHMIAHCYDMAFEEASAYHGEQVAVSTLYMAERQEICLAGARVHYADTVFPAKKMADFISKETSDGAHKEYTEKVKLIDSKKAGLDGRWQAAKEHINKIIIPFNQLKYKMECLGIGNNPTAIGWSNAGFVRSCELARFTRNRLTFLDIENSISISVS